MLKIIYCDCCREKMVSDRGMAFEVFEFISEYYHSVNQPVQFSINPHDSCYDRSILAMIRWLEGNRFVLTTESAKDEIYVKPLGFEYYTDEEDLIGHFCLHRREYA